MTSKILRRSLAALAASVAVVFAVAQEGEAAKPKPMSKPEATLKAGDKAPPLTIEKWVKGAPVASFEKGKTYVVEFWATWCGPCVASMPHLSDLSRELKGKGVTVIGCTSADPTNTLEKVEAMVKDKGDGMDYTVAWDKERTTSEAYMKAAGQNGIPCSFVIDQTGTIAWIGHPMFLDIVLEPVLAGKWDAKTGPQAVEKADQAISAVFMKAADAPKEALAAWEKLEQDYPKLAHQWADRKFNIYLSAGEYEAAYKLAGEIVDKAIKGKDASKLNDIAWTIVDPEGKVSRRDLDLAMKAATKADEFTNGKDAAIIDTLARVYFLKGDAKKAVELQTKAVDLAPAMQKASLQKSLDEYNKKAGGHE